VKENMPTTQFTDKRGRLIDIEFDEFRLECKARDHGVLLGTFSFDEADPDSDSSLLLLTHCHIEEVPGYTRCGIGEQMLQLAVDYGYSIFTRNHDGITRQDGSHLTEDAPAFVEAMVRKGLVQCEGNASDYDRYDD
jgi:hypothetical protein